MYQTAVRYKLSIRIHKSFGHIVFNRINLPAVVVYDYAMIAATSTFVLFIVHCWLQDNVDQDKRFGRLCSIVQLPWVRLLLLMDGWEMNDVSIDPALATSYIYRCV